MAGGGRKEAETGRQRAMVLAAGGTGGHLFPAQALAEVLSGRGYAVHLVSDERGAAYGGRFPATAIHAIPASTLTPRRPWRLPGQLLRLARGLAQSRRLLLAIAPGAVVGFGGYPSLPPLVAASRLGIPVVVHEQNAVMGRANRFLARRARIVATSFPEVAGLAGTSAPTVITGNPVRRAVIEVRDTPYSPPGADEVFRLLVVGGSQGARFFSDFMPRVIAELPLAVRRRLSLTQQCRPEDLARVKSACERLGVEAELKAFFDDLPRRIADAHLVVARAGASTVAELAVVGRPAIFVPLPHAIDHDQQRNAESWARAGAGWVRRQDDIDAAEFAAFLTRLRYGEEDLARAAGAARALGRPDAAERLAEVVIEAAGEGQGSNRT
jgi:UDP-N-acetylglucosamine--N-acetylmuramyl-(pentapeptide) pyrophosphoryl-undecaprenol N-acetylglucosamine transferase